MKDKLGWVVLVCVLVFVYIYFFRPEIVNAITGKFKDTTTASDVGGGFSNPEETTITTTTIPVHITWHPEDTKCPDSLHYTFSFTTTNFDEDCSCLYRMNDFVEGWKIENFGHMCCGHDFTEALNVPSNWEIINCYRGSQTGENVNYWYCKDIDIKKLFTDDKGNIQDTVEKHVTLVYDSSKDYVKTICNHVSPFGIYEFVNGVWQKG
jgi:hypothetical protein